MIKSNDLLYLGCSREGHHISGLTCVCIDSKCASRELVCEKCTKSEPHAGHENMLLSAFIQRAAELRYEQTHSQQFKDNLARLKELKIQVSNHIVGLKHDMGNLLRKLDETLLHIDREEAHILEQHPTSSIEFLYQPSLGLHVINQQLAKATAAYRQFIDDKKSSLFTKVKEVEDQAAQMMQEISQLRKQMDVLVKKQISTPTKWSKTLKHADIEIMDASTITRISNSNSSLSICALANRPLTTSASWNIRITQVSKRVGLGILNRNVAKIFGFSKRAMDQEQVPNLILLLSDGTRPKGYARITRGYPFPFGQGDTVELRFDVEKRELICSKPPNGNCVLEVKELLDPSDRYYPCAFLRNTKDSVQLTD